MEQPVKIVSSSNETWQITSPLQARADETAVSRILNQLEKLKYHEIIEEQPKDLASYGLDAPKLTVQIVLKKNLGERSVMVGGRNPVGNLYYLRVNKDPRVYTVEGSVGDISTITLFELRDKKLTDFTGEKVESLAFRTAKSDLLFRKESGVWKMKKPVESPASDNEISSLLSSLEFLRATEFIDKPSQNLADYGLGQPAAVAELQLEKGLQQKILFGGKEGDQIYCRVEGSSSIAKVSDSFTAYIDKKLDDWREKKLLVFNRFDAEEVRVKTADKEYILKKGKEEKWSQESPQKGELESDKVQDILEKLESAEISTYSDKPNLAIPPVLEVSLTLKDWQDKVSKKHLAFGAVHENLQAVKNDAYNTVVFANGALQKQLETALAELKPKPPTPPPAK